MIKNIVQKYLLKNIFHFLKYIFELNEIYAGPLSPIIGFDILKNKNLGKIQILL